MLSPHHVVRSNMSPPIWMVITAPNYSSDGGYTPVHKRDSDDLPIVKKEKRGEIETYLWLNGEVKPYRRLTDACKACHGILQGSGFQRFRDSGCHRFKNGAIIFLNLEALPEKIREVVKIAMEVTNDLRH